MQQRIIAVLLGLTVTAAWSSAIPSFPSSNATLVRRQRGQGDWDSECEVGQGLVSAIDTNAGPGQRPQLFTILWDAVANELCTLSGCNSGQRFCEDVGGGLSVCIEADGFWSQPDRQFFIDGTREIFDRTVTFSQGTGGQGSLETATDLVSLYKYEPTGSLRVNLAFQENNNDICPETVNVIAQGGALAAPGFGIIAYFCGLNAEPTAIV